MMKLQCDSLPSQSCHISGTNIKFGFQYNTPFNYCSNTWIGFSSSKNNTCYFPVLEVTLVLKPLLTISNPSLRVEFDVGFHILSSVTFHRAFRHLPSHYLVGQFISVHCAYMNRLRLSLFHLSCNLLFLLFWMLKMLASSCSLCAEYSL